jgi:prefoldin alpha subunit
MEGTVQTLQQRVELLDGAATDLNMSKDSLTELKELKAGSSLLVPVGGGTFVNANLGDIGKVIIGIGAEVSVEMELDKALDTIKSRFTEVEKAETSAQDQLSQVVNQMQIYQNVAQRLSAELQGDTT